jgi:hypothetical protein
MNPLDEILFVLCVIFGYKLCGGKEKNESVRQHETPKPKIHINLPSTLVLLVNSGNKFGHLSLSPRESKQGTTRVLEASTKAPQELPTFRISHKETKYSVDWSIPFLMALPSKLLGMVPSCGGTYPTSHLLARRKPM